MAEAISKPSIRKPPENPYAVLLKDAGLAALVALGVGAPLLGMQTVPGERGLALIPRPGLLLATVAAVFVGRFLLGLLLANRAGAARREAEAPPRIGPSPMAGAGKLVAPALLAFSVLMPVIPGIGRYEIDLGTLVLTYVMLGWGLNIVVGLAGLLDLGYVAFYAVGAYGYAIMAKYFDLSFWAALPLTGLFAAAWGIILGFPVLRLRGDYLAIVTLAFGEIIRVVLLNWTTLTGGPNGMSGVPRPTFFGLPFSMAGGEGTFAGFFGLEPSALHRVTFLYYVILALALLTNFVTIRLRRHPVGRAWEALREDEIAARALGLSAVAVKLTAFATGAMFGGFAGAFFATRQGFISPESFTFIESALILAIVVLGGMGSQLGVAIAATLMIGGFEVFRGLEEFRMLVFGVAMVAIMVWRPRGLVSGREPSVSLGKRTNIGSEHVAEGKG